MKPSLRENRTAAYVGPCLVFMVIMGLSDMFIKSKKAGAPWWLTDPEHWVYPIQTVVCLGLMWWWRRLYRLDFSATEQRPRACSTMAAVVWGTVIGLIGLYLWLLPGMLYQKYGTCGLPEKVAEYLGICSRDGKGFNPDVFARDSWQYFTSLGFRFLRMGVAVALLEEFFWRGFLWRYLSSDHTPHWWKIPFAQPWSRGLWATLLIWPLAHGSADWFGCLIYGAIISTLAVRTRSLLATVVCHGVTNIGLGIYVLKTGLWNYW